MKRSLFFVLISIVLLYLVRELEYIGIRKNKMGTFDKFNVCFVQRNNFDVLVLGSSRAESHYRTDLLSAATGMKCYNAGMVGATLPFIEGTLRAYLENNDAPKYVILNIDYHMFIASDDTIRHFPGYFPYLDNNSLYEKFNERDHRFLFFKYFPMYSLPFSGAKYLNISLRGYFNSPGKYDTTFHMGYAPIADVLPTDLDSVSLHPYRPQLKSASWESLENIISICHQKKIKLVFVMSPLYHRLSENITNEKEIIAHFQQIADKENFLLFNYALSPICYDKKMFADLDHLSRAGALQFTSNFSRDFIQYIHP